MVCPYNVVKHQKINNTSDSACVCVCEKEREREKEGGRERERGGREGEEKRETLSSKFISSQVYHAYITFGYDCEKHDQISLYACAEHIMTVA